MSEETKKTILVAEDETDQREALCAALEAAGYQVVATTNGEEAWQAFNEKTPDMVMLDLNMPKLNGMEVLEKIRTSEAGEKLPVCVLTAYDDINNVSNVTVIGGYHTDFLPKADNSLHQIIEHVDEHLK